MTKKNKLRAAGKNVLDVIRMVESGTGDGRIPASYRPMIKGLATDALNVEDCPESGSGIVKIFLEDDLVTNRDLMTALVQGCTVYGEDGETLWLNERGQLSTHGINASQVLTSCTNWKVGGEYDWYLIGRDLADGCNFRVECMCYNKGTGWREDRIVGYIPALDAPYVGENKTFYTQVIVLKSPSNYELPKMELT